MNSPLYCIDIKKMCDIKGPLHASFVDINNVFVACNKLKLDFCRDIYGREDIIGNSPCDLFTGQDPANLAACYTENKEIFKNKVPQQFYHSWTVKGLYQLDLLTFKMPILNVNGEILGIFAVSHFINKFSAQKSLQLGLSKRESECLFYLFEGYSAKEIAHIAKLSPRTIEGYIDHMKDKLGCATTSELLLKTQESKIKECVEIALGKSQPLYLSNPLSDCIKTSSTFRSVPVNLV